MRGEGVPPPVVAEPSLEHAERAFFPDSARRDSLRGRAGPRHGHFPGAAQGSLAPPQPDTVAWSQLQKSSTQGASAPQAPFAATPQPGDV